MIRFSVDVAVKAAALNRLTRSTDGVVGRSLTRGGEKVAARAKQNVNRMGRVDTGRMRDTIRVEPVQKTATGLSVAIVAPVRYARYQHDGTRYIRPAPFLTEALASTSPRDFL